jgi:hypothetical protein
MAQSPPTLAEVTRLRDEISSAYLLATTLKKQVGTLAADDATNVTLTTLELAVTNVYKVAVFIRGDYNTRQNEGSTEVNRIILLTSVVRAMLAAKEQAAKDSSAIASALSQVRVMPKVAD